MYEFLLTVLWLLHGTPITLVQPNTNVTMCVILPYPMNGKFQIVEDLRLPISPVALEGKLNGTKTCVKYTIKSKGVLGKLVNGLYVNIITDNLKIERLGYLKVENEVLKCLKVDVYSKGKEVSVALPNERLTVKVENECDKGMVVKVEADRVGYVDVTLAKDYLEPGDSAVYNITVPAYFINFENFGYVQGIVVRSSKVAYYLPVYDYVDFYIAKNLVVKWYYGGREVNEVSDGSEVKVCVETLSPPPVAKVPPIKAELKVIKDLTLRPDQVVKKIEFMINELPIKKCVTFIAKKDFLLRGYKVELDVYGKNVAKITAKPELKVK